MKESQFNTLLNVHMNQIKGITSKHVKGTNFPFDEMLSYLIEEFWDCCNNFDPRKNTKLKTYAEKRLRNKAADIKKSRKFMSYEEQVFFEPNDDDDVESTFEVAFGHHTEKDGVEEEVLYGKEKDQLQLISYLTDPVKVNDPITTAIVQEFLNSDKPTPTVIGKKLGLHNYTVIRKLRKLADNYDELQFGDYQDYLNNVG